MAVVTSREIHRCPIRSWQLHSSANKVTDGKKLFVGIFWLIYLREELLRNFIQIRTTKNSTKMRTYSNWWRGLSVH